MTQEERQILLDCGWKDEDVGKQHLTLVDTKSPYRVMYEEAGTSGGIMEAMRQAEVGDMLTVPPTPYGAIVHLKARRVGASNAMTNWLSENLTKDNEKGFKFYTGLEGAKQFDKAIKDIVNG